MKHPYILFSLVTILGLQACGPKLTAEACLIGDKATYQNLAFSTGNSVSESGISGPNNAGVEAYNRKRPIAGFQNRRKSEFAFYTKTTIPKLNATKDFSCQSEKLVCEDSQATFCQNMICEGTIPAGVEINLINTPTNLFYRTVEPTYMTWDGETLRCRPA